MRIATVGVLSSMLFGCFAPVDGFEAKHPTRVRGALRSNEGAQLEGAVVALLDENGVPLVKTRTDPNGAFELETSASGQTRFAAVLGAGWGAVGTWSLEARGVNEVGTLWLLPASEVPGLLEVHGLGLEEQQSHFEHGLSQFGRLVRISDGFLLGTADGTARLGPNGEVQRLWPSALQTQLAVTSTQASASGPPAGPCFATTQLIVEKMNPLPTSGAVTVVSAEGVELWRQALSNGPQTPGVQLLGQRCDARQLVMVVTDMLSGQSQALIFKPESAAPEVFDLGGPTSPSAQVAINDVLIAKDARFWNIATHQLQGSSSLPATLVDGNRWLLHDGTTLLLHDGATGVERTLIADVARGNVTQDPAHNRLLWWTSDGELTFISLDTGLRRSVAPLRPLDPLAAGCGARSGECEAHLDARGNLLALAVTREPQSRLVVDLDSGERWELPKSYKHGSWSRSANGSLFVQLLTEDGYSEIYSAAPGKTLALRTGTHRVREVLNVDRGMLMRWYDDRTSTVQLSYLDEDGP
jgi:hypothetical protein